MKNYLWFSNSLEKKHVVDRFETIARSLIKDKDFDLKSFSSAGSDTLEGALWRIYLCILETPIDKWSN